MIAVDDNKVSVHWGFFKVVAKDLYKEASQGQMMKAVMNRRQQALKNGRSVLEKLRSKNRPAYETSESEASSSSKVESFWETRNKELETLALVNERARHRKRDERRQATVSN